MAGIQIKFYYTVLLRLPRNIFLSTLSRDKERNDYTVFSIRTVRQYFGFASLWLYAVLNS
jgi:hypothetical protein